MQVSTLSRTLPGLQTFVFWCKYCRVFAFPFAEPFAFRYLRLAVVSHPSSYAFPPFFVRPPLTNIWFSPFFWRLQETHNTDYFLRLTVTIQPRSFFFFS